MYASISLKNKITNSRYLPYIVMYLKRSLSNRHLHHKNKFILMLLFSRDMQNCRIE